MAAEPETRTPPPGAVALAGQVLQAAVNEDWDTASAAIREISGRYGDDGVYTLIYGLCDSLIIAQGGVHGAAPARPHWVLDGTDDVTGADKVPAGVAWAGQLIAARAAMDHAMCSDIIRSAGDDATFSGYLSALVHVVALSLRNGERLDALRKQGKAGGSR